MNVKRVVLACAAVGAFAAPTTTAGAASTKTCSTADSPSNNWTTSNTQTNQCGSNGNVNVSPTTVTNPGGNTPPSKQP